MAEAIDKEQGCPHPCKLHAQDINHCTPASLTEVGGIPASDVLVMNADWATDQ